MDAVLSQTERLTLYRLLVEQANVVSAARRDTSRFYLTLNTAALGGMGFAFSERAAFPLEAILALALGLILVCLTWFSLLGYYGRIVQAKFEVIRSIEANFDVQPFEQETKLVRRRGRLAVGATFFEMMTPLAFVTVYLGTAVYAGVLVDWATIANGMAF